jgi:hypothetical protein
MVKKKWIYQNRKKGILKFNLTTKSTKAYNYQIKFNLAQPLTDINNKIMIYDFS